MLLVIGVLQSNYHMIISCDLMVILYNYIGGKNLVLSIIYPSLNYLSEVVG